MASVELLASGERGCTLQLEEVEVALLQSLARQLVDFLTPADQDEDPLVAMVGIDPAARTPDDPALARLLPDAVTGDPEASAQFRRFTERDLRAGKVRNAEAVLAALESGPASLDLTGDALAAWLGFLNDTRLTIGTRLEITEEAHEELASLPDDDPRAGLYQVYDWLTFVQEALLQSVVSSPETRT
jgi:hypothetical protein